jgi:hypothetical protein
MHHDKSRGLPDNTVTLDCETVEDAEASVAECLKLPAHEIRRYVCDPHKTDFAVNESQVRDRWLPMLNAVATREVEDIKDGYTCWFHATRVKDMNVFRTGIHPHSRRDLNDIWTMLGTSAEGLNISELQWRDLRRKVEKDNYGQPLDVLESWMSYPSQGPCAFLFAETALSPSKTGNYDFLKCPEVVDLILGSIEGIDREIAHGLRSRHRSETKPALVKFRTSRIEAAYLGAALDYLVYHNAGWPLNHLDPCFSASGHAISPEQIVCVIPIVESNSSPDTGYNYSFCPRSDRVSW